MMQLKNAKGVNQALKLIGKAFNFSSDDASKLMSMLQSSQESDDSDAEMELAAPAAAAYEEHGAGTLDVMEKLEAKAADLKDAAIKKEEKQEYDFEILKQSLSDDIRYAEAE